MNVDLNFWFRLANLAAMSGWFCLITLPRRRIVSQVVAPIFVPGLIAVLYLVLIVSAFRSGQGGFSSLDMVGRLFSNRSLLLAGWVHYLAFDLFIGAWEVRDSLRIGIRHYLVVPCLVLTFLFGPIGWLTYIVLRTWARRALPIETAV